MLAGVNPVIIRCLQVRTSDFSLNVSMFVEIIKYLFVNLIGNNRFHTIMQNKLQEFPPASKLDGKVYGNQTSTIRKEHIESNMDGLTVDEVIFKLARTFVVEVNSLFTLMVWFCCCYFHIWSIGYQTQEVVHIRSP